MGSCHSSTQVRLVTVVSSPSTSPYADLALLRISQRTSAFDLMRRSDLFSFSADIVVVIGFDFATVEPQCR